MRMDLETFEMFELVNGHMLLLTDCCVVSCRVVCRITLAEHDTTGTTTMYTRVYADNFWLNFKNKALEVGLYADHATQPYIISQSQHGMDHY